MLSTYKPRPGSKSRLVVNFRMLALFHPDVLSAVFYPLNRKVFEHAHLLDDYSNMLSRLAEHSPVEAGQALWVLEAMLHELQHQDCGQRT